MALSSTKQRNKAYLEDLRVKIREMTRESGIYKLLKEELSTVGYWKNLPRGNPVKAKEVSDKVKASTLT